LPGQKGRKHARRNKKDLVTLAYGPRRKKFLSNEESKTTLQQKDQIKSPTQESRSREPLICSGRHRTSARFLIIREKHDGLTNLILDLNRSHVAAYNPISLPIEIVYRLAVKKPGGGGGGHIEEPRAKQDGGICVPSQPPLEVKRRACEGGGAIWISRRRQDGAGRRALRPQKDSLVKRSQNALKIFARAGFPPERILVEKLKEKRKRGGGRSAASQNQTAAPRPPRRGVPPAERRLVGGKSGRPGGETSHRG